MQSHNDAIRLRICVICMLLIAAAGWIIYSLYVVQIARHDELLEKARKQYTAVKATSGKRGEIFDVHGHLLAGNEPGKNITCDPAIIAGLDVPRPEGEKVTPEKLRKEKERAEHRRRKTAFFLSQRLNLDYAETYKKLNPYRQMYDSSGNVILNADGTPKLALNRYVVIAKGLSLERGLDIQQQARQNKLNSLFFPDGYSRSYPKGKMLSNILGIARLKGDREEGELGLEKDFDKQISGRPGSETVERSRDGSPLHYGRHEEKQERDGYNIFLTIDEVVQSILEEELDAAYEKWKPKAVYAIIADPKGRILAIAQRPNFDPNEQVTGDDLRCRIAADGMEQGSIMKPFTVGRALDDGLVEPDTVIDCEKGTWMYLNRPLRDSHPYDRLTVEGVIQKSSNIGTAKIALKLGEKKLFDTLTKFGFGRPTNLPLKPEMKRPLLPLKRWDGLSITRFSIGYGVIVSPVQMLRAYCALANGGKLNELTLVDRIADPVTGRLVKMEVPPEISIFKNPETCNTLVKMMAKVTEDGGTAKNAAVKGYRVAGKTGTSRKYLPGSGYSSGKYYASFVGFVPAEKPAFVMLVTMDEPKGAYYGGTVAAPVFSKTAQSVLKYLNVPPDKPEELEAEKAKEKKK